MPRKPKRQAKVIRNLKEVSQRAKQEVKMLTSRLLEITVKMDEYIYSKKVIRACEAKCYLQELNNYEEHFTLDVRSQQVVEKLVNFMKRIIEEEAEELRANGTLGNFETVALPAQTYHENSFSFSGNRLSSPFDLNRLDGPNGYEGNMNLNFNVDINANAKTFNQLNESQRIQRSDRRQINNDQDTLLSQSVLQDHNYTSWEGPKPYHAPQDDTTSNIKRNAYVAEPRKSSSLLRASQKNNAFMAMPFQSPTVSKKIVLVKIPGDNRTKTPSSAKYIKITATPRRDMNIPPIYIRTPSNEPTKKVFLSNNSSLPANYSQKNEIAQIAPKKPGVPVAIAPETNVNKANLKEQIKKRTGKVQSEDEKIIKRPKRRGKRNSSQETNVSVEKAACNKKKRGKNKLKPNEEDLSWVENLNFVRVIEKDEICAPNMNVTDTFWKNLDYPPDWDDGIFLM